MGGSDVFQWAVKVGQRAVYGASPTDQPTSFAEVGLVRLDGTPLPTDELAGRVLLVVNVASRCGFTPQYAGLAALQRSHGPQGLTVIGAPCNQFLGQEPGTPEEIATTCRVTWGADFPLLEKQEVNGAGRSALYRFLVGSEAGGGADIAWNFEKFVVGRDGRVRARFPPKTEPDAPALVAALEAALGEPDGRGEPRIGPRMHLLTWNVAGLHEGRLDERTELQCLAVLLRSRPFDVIALQELVRRSWHGHWKHHLAAAGYRVIPSDPTATDSEYFAALAVRAELPTRGGAVRFPTSRMGRALVEVEVGPWLFLTAHLESERAGREERVRQADAVLQRLLAHPGPAVFAGDTNLRVEEEADLPRLASVTDAWDALGRPAESRATWRGGPYSARYDRIWCARARPTALEVVGTGVVPELAMSLSDHVGLAVDLAPSETLAVAVPIG